ncbi:MAG: hypothetical protein ACN2B6_00960 [Rickettsiales bacterium]
MTKLTVGQKFLSDKTSNTMEIVSISGSGRMMVKSSDGSEWSSQHDKFLEYVNAGKYTEIVEEPKELDKKKFQKVIKKIRDNRPRITGTYRNTGESYSRKDEYPKAMMTKQQINNRTATVNCGGSWSDKDKDRAEEVLLDQGFNDLMKEYGCQVTTELADGAQQIRIRW